MTAVLLVGLFAETLVFKGRTLPARWTPTSKAPPPCSSSAATTSSTRRSVRSPPLRPRHHKHRHPLRPAARRSRFRANSRESANESHTPTPPTIPNMKKTGKSQHAPHRTTHRRLRRPPLRFGAASTQKDPKDPAGFVRKCLDLDDIATRQARRRDATGRALVHRSPLARGGPTCLGTGAPCTVSLARGLSDGKISCICAGCD